MFLMAEAALLTKKLSAPSHKGVISLFGQHFAKTGILESHMGRTLHQAYDKRVIGDYGMGTFITREEAEGLLEAARDFIWKVKDYLSKWTEQEGQT